MTLAGRNNLTSGIWVRTARLLALICVLMCTIGIVAHTDDDALGLYHGAATSISHSSNVVATGVCAACQWASGIQTGAFYLVSAPVPRLHTLGIRPVLVESVATRPVRFTPLRGPPTS